LSGKIVTKIARIMVVLLLVCGGALFLLPGEKTPPTGAWLTRTGLTAQVLKVGRHDIRYVRTGQGPSVVLIHGLASSIYTWADLIPPLSERFDVVALDLPGFGASSQPGDLSFADLEPALTGLLDALGITKASFVGNSMGGAVSLRMAARAPARVDRVVILDAAGFKMQPGERPFMVRVLASEAAGYLADRLPIRRALTAATLRQLIHDPARVTDERIDEYTAPLLRPGALACSRSLLRSRFDESFVPDLARIEARTLVLWGRYDPWLPLEDADRFTAAIPGARKVVLETGHMPQEEKPLEVAKLVGDFLVS
jgi:pimeloyl-ACP methyl ester carboxylesterase